jgi:protein-L-isoaspartate(D-aspartate) O-methyltransferase
MDIENARAQMLGQQIRTWEVLDDRILGVLGQTQRELFVPKVYRDLAFADMKIPLAHSQQMMPPMLEGRLLQSLELKPEDFVLEVGTGSGFLTACLANLSDSVLSVDIFPDFTADARKKLDQINIKNAELRTEDVFNLSETMQFDAIAVTGSIPELDNHFIQMLRPGGKLFAIVGRAPVMEALLITAPSNEECTRESLFETVVPPLLNTTESELFVL